MPGCGQPACLGLDWPNVSYLPQGRPLQVLLNHPGPRLPLPVSWSQVHSFTHPFTHSFNKFLLSTIRNWGSHYGPSKDTVPKSRRLWSKKDDKC